MDFRDDLRSLMPASNVTRREFVVTALGAGFALAVRPVIAATTITTDTEGLEAGEVQIPTADGEIPAYRAMPAKDGAFATVLVVQEIFGVHEHIRDVCRRLAKLGYLAVAPELYARQGDPTSLQSPQDIMRLIVARVPDTQVLSDLDATAKWAAANRGDAKRLGITGFCWGGRIAWLYAAHNKDLKAAVAWYGRLVATSDELHPKQPIDLVGKLRAPVLGLYGGKDQGIPLETVEAMRKKIKDDGSRAAKKSEIIVYPEAGHAFNADYRPSYHKESAENGWKRMQEWFKQYDVV
jgi:carboxymethylenebutenolidase